jgi:hypothetical protein
MATADELWAWLGPPVRELRGSAEWTWEDWSARLLALLGVNRAEDHPVTEELLGRLAEMSDDERERVLASDEIEQLAYTVVQRQAEAAPTGVPADGAGDDYDEAAWQQFLIANGPTWDGSAESWPAFREWFLYEADQQGVGRPTTELVEYLDNMAPAERISAFARYGVKITGMAALYAQIRAIPNIDLLSEKEIEQIVNRTLHEMRR